MNVKITKDSKKVLTLDEMPIAKRIITELKDDDYKITDYARIAAHIVDRSFYAAECLKATAEIGKNSRTWDAYFEGSEDLDVWFIFYLYDGYGTFFEIGMYLSDLWNSDGTPEKSAEIREHSYIVKCTMERN